MKFLVREEGPLNDFLIYAGIIEEPLQIINTNLAVQLGLFYSYLPFMVLPIYASVERYNFILSEAAADLYATKWTTLTRILLPSIKPGLVAGCILVFVPSLGAFLAPDLLGGAKNFMIGSLIEEQFKGNAGNWPFGAAASMILLTMVMVLLMIFAHQQRRAEKPMNSKIDVKSYAGFREITWILSFHFIRASYRRDGLFFQCFGIYRGLGRLVLAMVY